MKLCFINICKYAIGLIFVFCILSLPGKVFAREDLQIVRVGADGLTSSAPAGTVSFSYNGATNTSANPVYSTDIFNTGSNGTIGTVVVQVTDLIDYYETIALCTYAIGSAECNVSASDFKSFYSYPNAQCQNIGGSCHIRTNVYPGMVTKAVVKYTQGPQVKVIRVGADGLLSSAPAGTWIYGVNTSSNVYYGNATTSSNPITVGSIDPYNKLSFGASKSSSYMQTVGVCTYPVGGTECNIPLSAFTSTLDCYNNSVACILNRSFDPGYVTKLAFRYEAISTPSITSTTVISRVGPDGTISSVPPNTTVQSNAFSGASSSNPVQYSSTLYPSTFQGQGYMLAVTDVPNYTESFGVCTYPVGSPSCTVPNQEFSYVGCYSNICSTQGGGNYSTMITNIVAKYEPSPQVKMYRVGADGLTTSSPNYTIFYQDSYVSTTTSANPFHYTYVRPDSFSFQSQDLPGYRKTLANCTYTIGSSECNVQASDFQDAYCGSGFGCFQSWQRIPPLTATKVVLKYVPVPSIKVSRVGTDGLTTSAPPGTTAKLNSGVASSSNSADFYSVSTGSTHTITVTDVPGYIESVGTCTYNEQSLTGCTVSSFLTSTSNISCNGTTCSIPQTIFSGNVTKVDVKYTPVGNIKITRYGSDLAWPSTAPAGTQGKVDSLTASSTNPSDYTNLSVGSHTAYATDITSYTELMGTCTYAIGGTECNIPPASFTIVPTCTGGFCSIPTTVTAGQVTKVGVKYTLNSPSGLTATTGVCSSKINLSWSAATGATGYRAYRSTTSGGTYTEITNVTTGTTSTSMVDVTPNASTTYYYKVASFNSTASSSQSSFVSGISSGLCTGSIRVSHYGTNLSTWPSPNLPSGTQSKIEDTDLDATNPRDYTGLTQGTHTVSVADISNYTETIGMCTYPEGGTECTLVSSDFAINPRCNGTLCSTPAPVTSGNRTKVAVMYTLTISPPTTPSTPTATSACNAGYTAADVTVSWSPSSGAVSYNVYRSSIQGGAGTLIGSPASSPYVDSGLGYGQTYYYSVSASNSGGDSAQTSQVEVITQSYCTGTCTNGAPNPLFNGAINYPTCSCPLGPEVNGTCTSTSTIAVISKFVAKPNIVNKGSPCNIQINVADSSGCTLSGTNGDVFNIDVSGGSAYQTSSSIQETTKFTLTCLGVGKGLDGNDLITNEETLCSVNSIIKER
jgi:hypothetical protein